MFPQALIRRRPRRILDQLFGEDEIPVVPPFNPPLFNPETAITRSRRVEPVPIPPAVDPTIALATRPRRAELRDYLADDTAYLRELETVPVERSRLKSAGAGFLAGGIPGLLTGALRPELAGEMRRDRELGRVRKRIDEQTGVRRAGLQEDLLQSQILENAAQAEKQLRPALPPEYTLGPDQVRYRGSEEVARGITRPKPQLIERTLSDGTKVMVPETEALKADATRQSRQETREDRLAREQTERESQRLSAQDEFDQLTADEAAAGEEKNRAYAYLEQLKRDPNIPKEDILEATRAAEAANSFYRSFGPKKAAAKAKVSRYSVSSRPDWPGKTLAPDIEARIRAAATQKGLDPNIAVERAQARL